MAEPGGPCFFWTITSWMGGGNEIVDRVKYLNRSQVEVPDRKSICPARPRRKVPMSRLSCVQNCLYPDFRAFQGKFVRSKIDSFCVHVQTIVRSKDLKSRLSCVQNCLCPDFRAFQGKFVRSKIDSFCVHVQTIVRSKDLKSRLSCVQNCLCPDFRAFQGKFVRSKIDSFCVHVQTIVRSKDLKSRLSCVQNCLCPDFRAFQRKNRALQNWTWGALCNESHLLLQTQMLHMPMFNF